MCASSLHCKLTSSRFAPLHSASERAMGKAIKDLNIKREELVLITKIYFGCGGTDPNATGLSRKHVIEAADQTLERAGLKYW